jgi:hypothetical protein
MTENMVGYAILGGYILGAIFTNYLLGRFASGLSWSAELDIGILMMAVVGWPITIVILIFSGAWNLGRRGQR